MAQIDSTIVIPPSNTTIQVHVPASQGVLNNPADSPFVDAGQGGTVSSGNAVKATQVTIAGNVRFANPS